MKKQFVFILALIGAATTISAQSGSAGGTFLNPDPRNYEVRQALEVESLVPMFFTGGYHFGVGYRYDKFRVRVSVINGGTYNADLQAVSGTVDGYKRYYTTSPGFFLGYNVWKNMEVYGYYERHTFEIEQLESGEKLDLPSNDFGIGISYQFFIGRTFYIQPGVHTYFRSEQNLGFSDGGTYTIPTFEISPVVRLGARLWRKY